jgi:hypothetical protein
MRLSKVATPNGPKHVASINTKNLVVLTVLVHILTKLRSKNMRCFYTIFGPFCVCILVHECLWNFFYRWTYLYVCFRSSFSFKPFCLFSFSKRNINDS